MPFRRELASVKQAMQILTSSETAEWYTPKPYTDAARDVMGSIDLDPASNWAANQWIQATHYFTVEDDGLSKPWNGNIFCNPPYGITKGRSNQDIWARYLESEHDNGATLQAIYLTKCVSGYKWWERLFRLWPVCFVEERIEFLQLDTEGNIVTKGRAKAGSNFWYIGPNVDRFATVYSQFGKIVYP